MCVSDFLCVDNDVSIMSTVTNGIFEGLCDDPRVWIPPPLLMSISTQGFALDCAQFIRVALIHGSGGGIRRIWSLGVEADKQREHAKHGKHRANWFGFAERMVCCVLKTIFKKSDFGSKRYRRHCRQQQPAGLQVGTSSRARRNTQLESESLQTRTTLP